MKAETKKLNEKDISKDFSLFTIEYNHIRWHVGLFRVKYTLVSIK
jgi:hypothetical protein